MKNGNFLKNNFYWKKGKRCYCVENKDNRFSFRIYSIIFIEFNGLILLIGKNSVFLFRVWENRGGEGR